jgi:hypothetical protein
MAELKRHVGCLNCLVDSLTLHYGLPSLFCTTKLSSNDLKPFLFMRANAPCYHFDYILCQSDAIEATLSSCQQDLLGSPLLLHYHLNLVLLAFLCCQIALHITSQLHWGLTTHDCVEPGSNKYSILCSSYHFKANEPIMISRYYYLLILGFFG